MTTLYVDRIEASKILKVSTRTVDRYMRKYRFKTRKDGRRVLIKRSDIDKIIKEHIGHFMNINDSNLDEILSKKESEKDMDKVSNLTFKDIKVEKVKEKAFKNIEGEIYKELYDETKKELKVKQERLEAATYRVGQLEAQTKNMVPMLEYNKRNEELRDISQAMEQKVKQNKETIQEVEAKFRSERIAKWIYLSLVGLLLVAEPILFLIWAFS